ncbi:MAG TPA: DUF3618 domain-containing protein [Longimicrobiales bacterium]|nr:DUF3618 domain-containing protein [Longimicrobiales bacterium]
MNERSEREIRESIETTRARMGETIEQIGDRVNPDRVKADLKARARDQIDGVKDNMKRKARNTMRDVEHGVSDTGRGIWATIRENPVPAGMVGVGVAWLLANRRNADTHRHYEYDTYSTGPAVPYRAGYTGSRYTEGRAYTGSGDYDSTSSAGYDSTTGYGTASGYGAAGSTAAYEAGTTGATGGLNRGYQDRVDARTTGFAAGAGSAQWSDDSNGQSEGMRERASEAVHQAGERVGNVVDDARERAGEMVHGAQERVGGAVHGTRDRVSSMAQSAKYRAQSAEHRVEESLRENPVAAGAMALAIGMAAGLMIPESDREHQMLGKARERVMDKAQDAVRRSADKLHDAARDAAGESARHAVDEVWPVGDEGQSSESTGGFSEPRR